MRQRGNHRNNKPKEKAQIVAPQKHCSYPKPSWLVLNLLPNNKVESKQCQVHPWTWENRSTTSLDAIYSTNNPQFLCPFKWSFIPTGSECFQPLLAMVDCASNLNQLISPQARCLLTMYIAPTTYACVHLVAFDDVVFDFVSWYIVLWKVQFIQISQSVARVCWTKKPAK